MKLRNAFTLYQGYSIFSKRDLSIKSDASPMMVKLKRQASTVLGSFKKVCNVWSAVYC